MASQTPTGTIPKERPTSAQEKGVVLFAAFEYKTMTRVAAMRATRLSGLR
ncbi:MAG: hypothetical protein A4E51_02082 [Methanosaeta sp. PtaU1.Bin055]|nr:MAG: hypothetical protein A4E51_02082 [Methanosaeta sp. PtaU1.Bin055]